jgi:hypothetical protein
MLATSRASVKAIAGAGDPRAPMGVEQKVKLQKQFKSSHEDSKSTAKSKAMRNWKKLPDEILSDEIPQVSANWLA